MMAGSPPKIFDEKDLRQLETMAGYGIPLRRMASILGIGHSTLERHIAKDSKVSGAVEKGRAKASLAVTKAAFDLASSGTCYAMTMFWLKCREGWREDGPKDLEDAADAIDFNKLKETYGPRLQAAG